MFVIGGAMSPSDKKGNKKAERAILRKKARKTPAPKKTTLEVRPKLAVSRAAAGKTASVLWVWALLGGWLLTLLAFLSLPNLRPVLPKWCPLINFPFWPFLIAGFAVMVAAARKVPQESAESDTPRPMADLFFFVLLGLAFFLRMDDAYRLPSLAWDDHYTILSGIRSILDLHNRSLLLAPDHRPPFFAYFAAGLWLLIPKATGITIVRLASTLMDLAAVWVCYLLGKEVGGRRMGLILMAMAVMAKQLVMTTKFDLGINETYLACSLILLFLFRVLKKPSLSHFLELGLALGFSDYTYSIVRPWIPTVIIGLLAWIMIRPSTRPRSRAGWTLGVGLAVAWAALFLGLNTSMFHTSFLTKFFIEGWGKFLAAGLLGVSYILVWRNGPGEKVLRDCSTGILLTALIEAPLWLDPFYNVNNNIHVTAQILWSPQFGLSLWGVIQKIVENIGVAFVYLFGASGIRELRIPPLSDSNLDFLAIAFCPLGLAVLLTKIDERKIAVLGLFLAGLAPVILTPGFQWPHWQVSIIPLLFAAAWGVYQWRQSIFLAAGRWGGYLGSLVLIGMVACFCWFNYQWMNTWESQRSTDLLGADTIRKNLSQDRVYLVPAYPNFVLATEDLLCEGEDIHQAGASNPIDLTPGEKGKDLAFVVYISDRATQDKLNKEFPGGNWGETKNYMGGSELCWREVPFDKVPENPSQMVFVRHVPESYWLRRFYGKYGLGRGLILAEDRVARWNESLPPCAAPDGRVRVSGRWDVTVPGPYQLKIHTLNLTQVFIDGRKILDEPGRTIYEKAENLSATVELSQGPHEVELVEAFTREMNIPDVTVYSINGLWKKSMDELTVTEVKKASR